jgi:hypothetical protein
MANDSQPDMGAMQHSMQGSGGGGVHSGGALAAGGEKLGGDVAANFTKVSGDLNNLGLDGKDHLEKLVQYGALSESPFSDLGDGSIIGPGNISHGGSEFATGFMGNVDLSNIKLKAQINAEIPRINSAGKEQGH